MVLRQLLVHQIEVVLAPVNPNPTTLPVTVLPFQMCRIQGWPHPCWSYQIAFAPALFGQIVPWLALNRGGLVVFVHPSTGDDLADHTDHAIWLGEQQELDLKGLG